METQAGYAQQHFGAVAGMSSLILESPAALPDQAAVQAVARILKQGGIAVFPTETVYGLGGNALSGEASKKIYQAKGRPSDNPLIVHIGALSELTALIAELPPKAAQLAQAFWPGPLTMIFKKSGAVPMETTAGLSTVAVRMPAHPVAHALIEACGFPIAAPSANLSGKPSPTKAEHVLTDMNGRADALLLSEDSSVGVESTVIDMTQEPPVILRPGMITREMIHQVIGEVLLSPGITTGEAPAHPASPGMKYTHYSPKAEVYVVSGSPEEQAEKIHRFVAECTGRAGILCCSNEACVYDHTNAFVLAPGADPVQYTKGLFAALRDFDKAGATAVYAEAPQAGDATLAAADRLLHAAGYRVL